MTTNGHEYSGTVMQKNLSDQRIEMCELAKWERNSMALKQKSVIGMKKEKMEGKTGSIKNAEVPVHFGNDCRQSCSASSIAAIVELSQQRSVWILKAVETVYGLH